VCTHDRLKHYNTLQHTAAHRNTLQHTAAHYNLRQHTATHCNTLQQTTTQRNTPSPWPMPGQNHQSEQTCEVLWPYAQLPPRQEFRPLGVQAHLVCPLVCVRERENQKVKERENKRERKWEKGRGRGGEGESPRECAWERKSESKKNRANLGVCMQAHTHAQKGSCPEYMQHPFRKQDNTIKKQAAYPLTQPPASPPKHRRSPPQTNCIWKPAPFSHFHFEKEKQLERVEK